MSLNLKKKYGEKKKKKKLKIPTPNQHSKCLFLYYSFIAIDYKYILFDDNAADAYELYSILFNLIHNMRQQDSHNEGLEDLIYIFLFFYFKNKKAAESFQAALVQ